MTAASPHRNARVAVLYGGPSAERDVSLNTGRLIHEALRRQQLDAHLIDAGPDLATRLADLRATVVFNALHGRFGEDGCVQGLLEWMRLPYTGTGVAGSAIGMDKVLSRRVFTAAGLPMADALILTDGTSSNPPTPPFGFPCVVKPAREGSSVGVSIVHDAAHYGPAIAAAAKFGGDIVVEQFIAGREISCAWLTGEVIGTIEIKPAVEFYDYHAKYLSNDTRYETPAQLNDDASRAIVEATRTLNAVIGARGATRADFIVPERGTPVLLEVNTLPGMTVHSLVPQVAAARGITFDELCLRILDDASLKG